MPNPKPGYARTYAFLPDFNETARDGLVEVECLKTAPHGGGLSILGLDDDLSYDAKQRIHAALADCGYATLVCDASYLVSLTPSPHAWPGSDMLDVPIALAMLAVAERGGLDAAKVAHVSTYGKLTFDAQIRIFEPQPFDHDAPACAREHIVEHDPRLMPVTRMTLDELVAYIACPAVQAADSLAERNAS